MVVVYDPRMNQRVVDCLLQVSNVTFTFVWPDGFNGEFILTRYAPPFGLFLDFP
jgi:hypothetical protein